MKITKDFVPELIKEIQKCGISRFNIKCVWHYGSSLYVKHYDDYDFKVIVKNRTEHTRNTIETKVLGSKCHIVFYTQSEWNDIMNERDQCVVTECNEMECIYGSEEGLIKYDVIHDEEVKRYVLILFDENFFNCTNQDFYLGDKRLWNFLLYAFKVKNKSNRLSWYQRHLINKAHDLKIDKEKFRPLFERLKEEIL